MDRIKIDHDYVVIESFGDRRITAGTVVTVVETKEWVPGFVYCYGRCGGSAYIRKDNLLPLINHQ